MCRVVAACDEGGLVFWKVIRTSRLGNFTVYVDMECSRGIVRVCGGVNKDIAIE